MGIIKAAIQTVTGSIQDQFLEVIEADGMNETTVMVPGVPVRKGGNKGTPGTVSNGSVIHVGKNQFMLLVDGGKIVDYSAEEGYFTVENSSLPSAFNGDMGAAIDEAFNRFKYGGITPSAQHVYFINLQEIKGIRFGTRTPLNYFDNTYNAELFLKMHGSYSVKITNPLLFYAEALPRGLTKVDIADMNEQFMNEFLQALTATINQMSVDGVRISHLASKSMELSKYMASVLDEEWRAARGIEVQSVAIAGIAYDDESQKLINMRNQGAMMGDAAIREGYVQSAVAKGIENAGSNSAGAGAGFVGVNMGLNAAAGVGSFSAANNAQMAQETEKNTWACTCGQKNSDSAAFCSSCGTPRATGWACSCGQTNNGAFCTACGKAKPAKKSCAACGKSVPDTAAFCPHCGKQV